MAAVPLGKWSYFSRALGPAQIPPKAFKSGAQATTLPPAAAGMSVFGGHWGGCGDGRALGGCAPTSSRQQDVLRWRPRALQKAMREQARRQGSAQQVRDVTHHGGHERSARALRAVPFCCRSAPHPLGWTLQWPRPAAARRRERRQQQQRQRAACASLQSTTTARAACPSRTSPMRSWRPGVRP